MVGGGGSFCGDWGLFALVMDFKEGMLTSPPELAHFGVCRGAGGEGRGGPMRGLELIM